MACVAPEAVWIRRRALTVLQRVLACARPEEGCALLLGGRGDAAWLVERIWPCLNVWEPADERIHRFALDPREQLLAQKWGRERGLQVLAPAHAHPDSPAQPSATDLALAFPPTLMVILDGREPGPLPSGDDRLGIWWLEEPPQPAQAPLPRRLVWRMVD